VQQPLRGVGVGAEARGDVARGARLGGEHVGDAELGGGVDDLRDPQAGDHLRQSQRVVHATSVRRGAAAILEGIYLSKIAARSPSSGSSSLGVAPAKRLMSRHMCD
jgi:hypothetical protein